MINMTTDGKLYTKNKICIKFPYIKCVFFHMSCPFHLFELSFCLSAYLCVCLAVFISVCLSFCLYLSFYLSMFYGQFVLLLLLNNYYFIYLEDDWSPYIPDVLRGSRLKSDQPTYQTIQSSIHSSSPQSSKSSLQATGDQS